MSRNAKRSSTPSASKKRTARASAAKGAGSLVLGTGPLEVAEVEAVAAGARPIDVGPSAVRAIKASRRIIEGVLADGQPYYGINTGFGSLAKRRIDDGDLQALQLNLVRSHSAGVSDPLPERVVRAMMSLLAASLCRGLSGVRPEVPKRLCVMLNSGCVPIVPSVGSVGASGDLAPLAAVALALVGEGRVTLRGRVMSAAKAHAILKLKPLVLEAKEGLALINGTHLMAAEGALLIAGCGRLLSAAIGALAMTIDACRATDAFLDERLYRARNHPDAMFVAHEVAGMLEGSTILTSHVEDDPRVQDPYSLRAGPTVLGAVHAAMAEVSACIAGELGAVTDNPLVFPKGEHKVGRAVVSSEADAIVSGANFHGMPIALPLDYFTIALCHIAGISERRSYLMTGAFEPESKLKPFLAPQPGLHSGLMIAQYAAAACVNEIVNISNPATVANISTCAGMEDYNSFGPRAAAKARRAMHLATRVVAIELLIAAQGIDMHRPLRSGAGVERLHAAIRRRVRKLTNDRPLTEDIEAIAELIESGTLGG